MDASLNGPFGHVSLTPDTLTIGRIPSNKLVLNDLKASSRHAEIRSIGNGYTITDMGSTNGTFVNEQQLRPHEPRQLITGDTIRIGDTRFTYESSVAPQIDPTVYAEKGASPGYDPTVAAPPPVANTAYGMGQQNDLPYAQNTPPPIQPAYGQPAAYPPPPVPMYGQPDAAYPPLQPAPPPYGYPPAILPKRSNRTLFIILGSVVGSLILLCILVSVVVYATRSTPDKTLNTYCDGLKSGDYQTAYNQLSHTIQNQESEAQFASAFTSTNLKVTDCTVSNTSDDGTVGIGTISYTTNTNFSGINDYRLIQESGAWKINSQTPRK
ncbi:MAG: hypothetical protein PVS3B3_32760 [Ktedonobacteraceae bacterium]